jgi:hypothetical protein
MLSQGVAAALALSVLFARCHTLQNSAQIWHVGLHSNGHEVLVRLNHYQYLSLPEHLTFN